MDLVKPIDPDTLDRAVRAELARHVAADLIDRSAADSLATLIRERQVRDATVSGEAA
jgi:hypothetical protein